MCFDFIYGTIVSFWQPHLPIDNRKNEIKSAATTILVQLQPEKTQNPPLWQRVKGNYPTEDRKEIELEKTSVSVVESLYGHNNSTVDYSSKMKRSWPGHSEVEVNDNPAIDDPPQKKQSSSGQWEGMWEVENNDNPAIDNPPEMKRSSCSGQSEVDVNDNPAIDNPLQMGQSSSGQWEGMWEVEYNDNPAIGYPPPQMKRSSSEQWEEDNNPAICYPPPQKKRLLCSGQWEVEDNDNTSCWSSKRLLLDLKELWQDAPKGIHASPSEENIYSWNILFPAPNQKKVEATLHFEPNYPFVPPAIIIKKRLFHPNITPEGKVCLQDLQQMWTPAYSIWSLILSVQLLLDDPNPNNAVNAVAGKMLMKYPQAYYNQAWQCFEMLDSDRNVNLEDFKEDEWEFLFGDLN